MIVVASTSDNKGNSPNSSWLLNSRAFHMIKNDFLLQDPSPYYIITLGNDTILLILNSRKAYINLNECTLKFNDVL